MQNPSSAILLAYSACGASVFVIGRGGIKGAILELIHIIESDIQFLRV